MSSLNHGNNNNQNNNNTDTQWLAMKQSLLRILGGTKGQEIFDKCLEICNSEKFDLEEFKEDLLDFADNDSLFMDKFLEKFPEYKDHKNELYELLKCVFVTSCNDSIFLNGLITMDNDLKNIIDENDTNFGVVVNHQRNKPLIYNYDNQDTPALNQRNYCHSIPLDYTQKYEDKHYENDDDDNDHNHNNNLEVDCVNFLVLFNTFCDNINERTYPKIKQDLLIEIKQNFDEIYSLDTVSTV